MTSTNDITGDRIISKPTSDAYRQNWDRVFSKPSPKFELINDIRYCCVRCPYSNEKESVGINIYCSLLHRQLDYYDGPLAEC